MGRENQDLHATVSSVVPGVPASLITASISSACRTESQPSSSAITRAAASTETRERARNRAETGSPEHHVAQPDRHFLTHSPHDLLTPEHCRIAPLLLRSGVLELPLAGATGRAGSLQ